MAGLRPLVDALSRHRPRRPRQGPDDRHRVRHGASTPRRSSGPASSAACSCSSAASRRVRMSPALTVGEAEIDDRAADLRRGGGRGGRPRPSRSAEPARSTARGPAAAARRPGDDAGVSTSKVATMRDAIADLVRDGDTVAIEGFTHLICFAAGHEIIRQRKRDLTLARLTPDLIYDQMIAAGVARKLIFSLARQPGRRRARTRSGGGSRTPIPATARDRGVQPLRDGRPVHGRRDEPAVLPAPQLLRDRPAEGEPAHPADRVAVRRRDRLRGPAAPAGRHDRPRPARRRRRRHPGLGPARLPEGGGVRGRAGHRRGRGARRRGGHPGRPEPDDHPGPDRGRRRRRAVRGAIRRTSRAPTTATTASTSTGIRSPATRPRLQAWLRDWVYDLDGRAAYVDEARRRAGRRRCGRGPAPSGSVDYGEYR